MMILSVAKLDDAEDALKKGQVILFPDLNKLFNIPNYETLILFNQIL